MQRPTDEEINLKLKQKMTNMQMVFISSKYPMNADGYQLIEQIGEGMMSNKVYKAEFKGGYVAIKQIDLSQQSHETKEKITREVQGMSVVVESEFVVHFLCSFVFEETLWIVMDLQEGSVRDVLKWKFPQGIDDEYVLCSILHQALQGIQFLHEHNIIHRDIKAGNILFNKEGQIKLADFGVSAVLASHDERRTTMAGTWHWMAPEVIDPSEHGGYDFKADVWSIGITCIELAYGVAPYGDARPNQVIVYIMQNPPPNLENPRVPLATNIKKYSSHLKELVSKCLQSDPRKRPTASKLLNHKFFKETLKNMSDSNEYLKTALLEGLPSIGERFRRQQEIKKENLKLNLKNQNPKLPFTLIKEKSGPALLPTGSFKPKNERHERGDKSDRHERGDKSDRYERGDKSDRYERGDKTDKYERAEKNEKGEKYERAERNEKGDKYERAEKERNEKEKYERGEKYEKERSEKYERGERYEKERSEKGEKYERAEKERNEKEKYERAERMEKERSERGEKYERAERMEKERSERAERIEKERSERGERYEKEKSEKSDKDKEKNLKSFQLDLDKNDKHRGRDKDKEDSKSKSKRSPASPRLSDLHYTAPASPRGQETILSASPRAAHKSPRSKSPSEEN